LKQNWSGARRLRCAFTRTWENAPGKEVTGLIEALKEPDRHAEAAELIRALVERIVFAGGGEPENGLPSISTAVWPSFQETGGKPPLTTLVAGAGFEPAAFRL
jgi:hypothetical protein